MQGQKQGAKSLLCCGAENVFSDNSCWKKYGLKLHYRELEITSACGGQETCVLVLDFLSEGNVNGKVVKELSDRNAKFYC